MSAIVEKEFDRNLKPRERHRGFPKISLRQRAADHPMIMFVLIAVAAFTAMAAVPPAGSPLVSFGVSAAVSAPALDAGGRANVGPAGIGIACQGQAWGAESAECLATIASETGARHGRTVRVIAGS